MLVHGRVSAPGSAVFRTPHSSHLHLEWSSKASAPLSFLQTLRCFLYRNNNSPETLAQHTSSIPVACVPAQAHYEAKLPQFDTVFMNAAEASKCEVQALRNIARSVQPSHLWRFAPPCAKSYKVIAHEKIIQLIVQPILPCGLPMPRPVASASKAQPTLRQVLATATLRPPVLDLALFFQGRRRSRSRSCGGGGCPRLQLPSLCKETFESPQALDE